MFCTVYLDLIMYVDIYTLLKSFSAAQKKVGISKLEPASLQILSMGTTTTHGPSVSGFSRAPSPSSVVQHRSRYIR